MVTNNKFWIFLTSGNVPVSLMGNKNVNPNVPQILIFHILITFSVNNYVMNFKTKLKFSFVLQDESKTCKKSSIPVTF